MFKDVAPDRWSAPSISRVAKAGLMTGDENGFRPTDCITREEMASILDRQLFRDGLFTDVLPEIKPAVVALHRADGGIGSGAFISNSYIITNKHVVADFKELTIIKDGQPNKTGRVAYISHSHDLALVATEEQSVYLKIAKQDVIQGEHVGIIGAPRGYLESFSQGQVSHVLRSTSPATDPDCFQTDAPINPGNSGGPAINEKGELVGVAVAKFVDVAVEGIGFCIHAKYVREFLKECGVDVSGKKPEDPNRLSEHFTKQEFTCKCGCGQLKVDSKLINLLEKLRAEVGRPVYISSGYRCPKHNKAVGGADDSYHMKGMAADITIPQHNPCEIGQIARKLGFGGIGTYTNGGNFFCHVDVGPVRNWTD